VEKVGYFFADDPGYGKDDDEPKEYPTVLLRLIDKPAGPRWFKTFLAGLNRAALASDDPHDRVQLTKDNPLLFALTYLSHHLHSAETNDKLSFAEFHLDLLEQAKNWTIRPTRPREFRDAYVAPRGVGKSTWLFTILPIWAAAHGHVKFIVAFSDSGDQSKNHLSTIRTEFDTNDLLAQDFPTLCTAKVRRPGGPMGKKLVSQRVDQIEQANGFVMLAKGSGAAARGMKIGKLRPDLIILDDIEPGEEKYSHAVMEYRLRWMQETVFHLNEHARVVIVGTVTAPGSIMHQLVESLLHPSEDTPTWIASQKINVHYYAPILQNNDGTERSCWPAKWSLEYLKSIESTREYAKEFLNQPVSLHGSYWSQDDFVYADLPTVFDLLVLDPAVTSHRLSHDTGLAIVGLHAGGVPMANGRISQRCAVIKYATRVKLPPRELRETVLWYLEQWPEIGVLVVETNQGGDTWQSVFHDIPVRMVQSWSSFPKPVRLSRLLNAYQRGWVVHATALPRLETEQCAYEGTGSRAEEPDMIDAVEIGVRQFIKPPGKRRTGGTYSYGRVTPIGAGVQD
jgi:hypothetical protein